MEVAVTGILTGNNNWNRGEGATSRQEQGCGGGGVEREEKEGARVWE